MVGWGFNALKEGSLLLWPCGWPVERARGEATASPGKKKSSRELELELQVEGLVRTFTIIILYSFKQHSTQVKLGNQIQLSS